ncbi:unnamed protein product [Rotaria sp. Silwood1]|nr:unnamed protein product [Rotaria sp. Silwood1]CAF3419126.1 unnamed protein product [Rotaria sp. Silwood1]CAF4602518.1 unnamed protein product [Rotaria sp. Silwood1]CAF4709530.1 unnamed protein product [Rotaria sp. Silwood1]CAF4871956.1 unnamed protein product [Rotaria sp. Silwood1]
MSFGRCVKEENVQTAIIDFNDWASQDIKDDTYSKPVTFDLQSLFESIKASNSTIELKLSANLLLTDMQRLN